MNTARSSGQTARGATRLQTIRPLPPPPPPPPLHLRQPPERTSLAGRAASPFSSPPASWISLPLGLPRRSSCRRKPLIRAPPPPPAPRRRSLTGELTSWRPSPRTRCPPPPTAPRRRTPSWAPAPTGREMKLCPSPPHPVHSPAKAGSPVPFTQPPPLSSWPPSICHAPRRVNRRVALQRRAGNFAPFGFSFIQLLFTVTTPNVFRHFKLQHVSLVTYLCLLLCSNYFVCFSQTKLNNYNFSPVTFTSTLRQHTD